MQGGADRVGVEMPPAGANVLVRAQQIERVGVRAEATSEETFGVLDDLQTVGAAGFDVARLYEKRPDRQGSESADPRGRKFTTVAEIDACEIATNLVQEPSRLASNAH